MPKKETQTKYFNSHQICSGCKRKRERALRENCTHIACVKSSSRSSRTARCLFTVRMASRVYYTPLSLPSPYLPPYPTQSYQRICLCVLFNNLSDFSGKLPQSADNDNFFGSQSKQKARQDARKGVGGGAAACDELVPCGLYSTGGSTGR